MNKEQYGRYMDILRRKAEGESYASIARSYDITREAVRQKLIRMPASVPITVHDNRSEELGLRDRIAIRGEERRKSRSSMLANRSIRRKIKNKYPSSSPRERIIKALGGKCKVCGFKDYRALQIDHVNGGGLKEVTINGGMGKVITKLHKRILRGEIITEYQVLCANCNWIKRSTNRELF